MVGFEEAKPARNLIFLVLFAGSASKEHQKGSLLEGLQPSKNDPFLVLFAGSAGK